MAGLSTMPPLLQSANLPDDLNAVKAIALEQNRLARQWWEQVELLKYQLAQHVRARFGASSEQLMRQGELFAETVSVTVPPEAPDTKVAAHVRRGRTALPKDLPRQRIEYDLSDAEKAQFDHVTRMGEDVSETLDYTPARLTVIEHVRFKYACTKGEDSTVRTAFAQPSPLPKSNASAGLLAQICVSTFVDHLPLSRQEAIFRRHHVHLPRSTLCDWKLGTAELLQVLMPPLKTHLLNAPRVHADDTTMPLRVPGRPATRTARLWGYLGAGQRHENGLWVDHPPAVLFEFAQSRQGLHPLEFLKDYQGYLQADAYSGHAALYRSKRIIEVGCWAHCRRRFYEVARTQPTPGLAAQALAWIARLYAIETTLAGATPDRKREVRRAQSVPLLQLMRQWLDAHVSELLPTSPIGKAFGYALGNWEALMRYTDNGVLEPDNNALERAIRPIAIGRANYLFVGSPRGGHAAATMYSLLGTARLNGLNPYDWLRQTLIELPGWPSDRVAQLLPLSRQPD